jgi:hypothetical protein
MGTRDKGEDAQCTKVRSSQCAVRRKKMVIFQVNVELFGRFDNRTYVLRNYEI